MTIKECLDHYQITGIRHFNLIYSSILYDIIVDEQEKFSLLSWKITLRRKSQMGIIEDCEVWDHELLKCLEDSDEWEIV